MIRKTIICNMCHATQAELCEVKINSFQSEGMHAVVSVERDQDLFDDHICDSCIEGLVQIYAERKAGMI